MSGCWPPTGAARSRLPPFVGSSALAIAAAGNWSPEDASTVEPEYGSELDGPALEPATLEDEAAP